MLNIALTGKQKQKKWTVLAPCVFNRWWTLLRLAAAQPALQMDVLQRGMYHSGDILSPHETRWGCSWESKVFKTQISSSHRRILQGASTVVMKQSLGCCESSKDLCFSFSLFDILVTWAPVSLINIPLWQDTAVMSLFHAGKGAKDNSVGLQKGCRAGRLNKQQLPQKNRRRRQSWKWTQRLKKKGKKNRERDDKLITELSKWYSVPADGLQVA